LVTEFAAAGGTSGAASAWRISLAWSDRFKSFEHFRMIDKESCAGNLAVPNLIVDEQFWRASLALNDRNRYAARNRSVSDRADEGWLAHFPSGLTSATVSITQAGRLRGPISVDQYFEEAQASEFGSATAPGEFLTPFCRRKRMGTIPVAF
jgi:hypothetical protein